MLEAKRSNLTFYLPHFSVVNQNKPSLRLVFDAAIYVFFNLRKVPIAVTGDISGMLLHIETRMADQNCQHFWNGMMSCQMSSVHGGCQGLKN